MVGELYPEGGARRDAGFTVFYMGINLGAALGPLVCSALGEKVNWHYGFAAAGVGMVLGLAQYRLSAKHLGPPGWRAGQQEGVRGRDWLLLAGLGCAVVLLVALVAMRVVRINPLTLAQGARNLIVGVAVLYFTAVF